MDIYNYYSAAYSRPYHLDPLWNPLPSYDLDAHLAMLSMNDTLPQVCEFDVIVPSHSEGPTHITAAPEASQTSCSDVEELANRCAIGNYRNSATDSP